MGFGVSGFSPCPGSTAIRSARAGAAIPWPTAPSTAVSEVWEGLGVEEFGVSEERNWVWGNSGQDMRVLFS